MTDIALFILTVVSLPVHYHSPKQKTVHLCGYTSNFKNDKLERRIKNYRAIACRKLNIFAKCFLKIVRFKINLTFASPLQFAWSCQNNNFLYIACPVNTCLHV